MTRLAVLFVLGASAASSLIFADDSKKEPQPRVSLSLNGHDFSMPVGPSEGQSGLIPVAKGHVVALRVVPHLEGNDVVVKVTALLGDLQGEDADLSCAQAKSWTRQEEVGSYRLGENDSLQLSDIERYALPPMAVKFVKVLGVGPGGCAGCGCDNGICCLPNPGQCMTCSNCGRCCNNM